MAERTNSKLDLDHVLAWKILSGKRSHVLCLLVILALPPRTVALLRPSQRCTRNPSLRREHLQSSPNTGAYNLTRLNRDISRSNLPVRSSSVLLFPVSLFRSVQSQLSINSCVHNNASKTFLHHKRKLCSPKLFKLTSKSNKQTKGVPVSS